MAFPEHSSDWYNIDNHPMYLYYNKNDHNVEPHYDYLVLQNASLHN